MCFSEFILKGDFDIHSSLEEVYIDFINFSWWPQVLFILWNRSSWDWLRVTGRKEWNQCALHLERSIKDSAVFILHSFCIHFAFFWNTWEVNIPDMWTRPFKRESHKLYPCLLWWDPLDQWGLSTWVMPLGIIKWLNSYFTVSPKQKYRLLSSRVLNCDRARWKLLMCNISI